MHSAPIDAFRPPDSWLRGKVRTVAMLLFLAMFGLGAAAIGMVMLLEAEAPGGWGMALLCITFGLATLFACPLFRPAPSGLNVDLVSAMANGRLQQGLSFGYRASARFLQPLGLSLFAIVMLGFDVVVVRDMATLFAAGTSMGGITDVLGALWTLLWGGFLLAASLYIAVRAVVALRRIGEQTTIVLSPLGLRCSTGGVGCLRPGTTSRTCSRSRSEATR